MNFMPWPRGPYLYPHPILSEVMTEYPPASDPKLVTDIAGAMLDTMEALGGIGLAAPQVGLRWRLFVSTFGVFIDPQIFTGPEPTLVAMKEGCLSFPGRVEKITRPQVVTLSAFDLKGRHYSQNLTGWEARVAQHEVDHLNGILFIDYLEKPCKTD
jgi:peptide deformylase